MPDIPSSSKVIELLIDIHILELAWPDQPSPETIPLSTLREPEASCFEGVDYAVVGVRRTVDFKSQSRERLQIILSELLDAFFLARSRHLKERWIIEKDCWLTTWNATVHQCYDIIGWPTKECFLETSVLTRRIDKIFRLFDD